MRTNIILGWLLSLAFLIGMAGPLFGTCTQGDDDPWLGGLFIFAPIGLIGLAIAASGAKLGRLYSLLALPHAATLYLGIKFIPTYFLQTTILGIHACSVRESGDFETPASMTQRLWAPVWFCLLLVMIYVIFLYWQKNHLRHRG